MQVVGITLPDNGCVTTSGTSVTYTPHAGYAGTDNFTYTISGGDTATVTVTVIGTLDTAPSVSVTGPSVTTYTVGDNITFTGTATDTEDGTLTSGLSWVSDQDGAIGSGGSFSTSSLTQGTHTITTSVTDSGGSTSTDTISVTINPIVTNDAPVVTITTPVAMTFTEGDNITFTGTANDTEDGTLTNGLQWTSDQDGAIGSGGSFSTNSLTQGTHTITASVTDSGGSMSTDAITVIINPIVTNDVPVVIITGPAVTTFTEGDNVTFTGTATDTEDGMLTNGLQWTSDQDGVIGSGGNFSTSSLSQGAHIITVSVTDSGGSTSTDAITVIINPIVTNDTPAVTIIGPVVTTYIVGDNVTFTGTATDTEDGMLTNGLQWASDQDGVIGSGGNFSTSSLSQGAHTITASVTDSVGHVGTDTIIVTMTLVGGSGGNNIVFSDDFEVNLGWVVNPSSADTATTGIWERAMPDVTVDAGITMQLDAVSGTHVLATEAAMGATPAERDIDNGSTSIRSPDIVLPVLSPGEHLQISFSYNFAHNATASSTDDYLKVTLVGATSTVIIDERGGSGARGGVWQPYRTQMDQHAGETVYLLIEAADDAGGTLVEAQIDDLVIEVVTPTAAVFRDDFETDQGWTTNPSGTDTATTGMWEWANPEGTYYTGVKQLGTTVNGNKGLVTQALAGSHGGIYDIDGGLTSIRSPDIVLPSLSAADDNLELSLYYNFAHTNNSSVDDEFRITLVGNSNTVLYEELGAASNQNGRWQELMVNLNSHAGQTVYLLIEASDKGSGSIVDAQIDDVVIVKTGSE
jgi:hypothetical protein